MSGIYNNGIRDYCGEESSITKLSNHFSKDYAFQQDGINDFNNQKASDPIPSSFDLNDLFNELVNRNSNNGSSDMRPQPTENVTNLSMDNKTFPTTAAVANNNENPLLLSSVAGFRSPNFTITHNIPVQRFVPPDQSFVAQQWAEDELSRFDDKIIDEEDLQKLSQRNSMKFLDVVRNLSLSEQKADFDELNENSTLNDNRFLYDLEEDLKEMRAKLDLDANTSDVWKQIERSIEESSRSFVKNKSSTNFVFQQSNQYLKELEDNQKLNGEKLAIDEMLQKGIKLYREGYFAKASMVFEAVVQIKPDCESGWSHLAMSLSENEQDDRARIACEKCLKLNANNREILLSLARINCNEMNLSSTIACLELWLLANPKYSDLATVGQQAIHSINENSQFSSEDMYEMAFESSGKFAILDEQLNVALSRNSINIDPELEIVAGTLYHSIQDYDKAVQRFEAAVNVVKDNACLWNKLGTSYCNAGNYEKSVDAYKKALEFAPGFARAECNLGVAYYNMELYKEAIEHAIRAYRIQHVEKLNRVNSDNDSVQSDPIWTLIRMSSFKLDRTDLDLVIFNKDIDTLSKEFDV